MPQRIPARIELKPAQRTALDALSNDGVAELSRSGYQDLTGMSRSQAAYDLAELVEAGMLERIGGGRSTRYRLVQESDPTQRQWTNERIREELVRFCAGREVWPSAREFKQTGRTDLYVAASRYGGVAFWAAELDLPRGGDRLPSRRTLPPLRRFSWAVCGAAAGALLVGFVVFVVHGRPGPKPRTAAPAVVVQQEALAPPRPQHSRAEGPRAGRKTVGRPTTRARARTASPATAVATAPASQAVSRPVHASSRATTRQAARIVPASTPPPGPTPLAAPAGAGGTPPPLPAP